MNLNRKFSRKKTLRVTSYNTLADCHIKRDFYGFCKEEHLFRGSDGTSHRHQLLMKELDHISSDINCLQEVEAGPYVECLRSEFAKRNHDLVFEKKIGDAKEGLAISYDNKQFQCLEKRRVVYKDGMLDFAKKTSIPVDYMETNLMVSHIALICVFRCLQTETVFIVGTTHILYNQLRKPDIQLLEGYVLMKNVSDLCHELVSSKLSPDIDSIPIMICGDFNSEPGHYLYNFMKKHRFNNDELEELKYLTYKITNLRSIKQKRSEPSVVSEHFKDVVENPLPLKSAYEEYNGNEPRMTSADSILNATLDYMFISSNIHVTGVLQIDDDIIKEYEKGGPGEHFASDHLPLAADLLLPCKISNVLSSKNISA